MGESIWDKDEVTWLLRAFPLFSKLIFVFPPFFSSLSFQALNELLFRKKCYVSGISWVHVNTETDA